MMKLRRIDGPRIPGSGILAASIAIALGIIAVAAPLRGSAFGEPTVLRPQRLVPIAVDASQTSAPWLAGPGALPELDDHLLGEPGPRTEPSRHAVDTASAAEAELHHHLRVPQKLPEGLMGDPNPSVFSASSYAYKLDLRKINAALKDANLDDVQLPTSIHGATIVLNIPAGATLHWGNRRSGLSLTEVRLPTLTVPAEIDLATLHDVLLADPRIEQLNPDVIAQLRDIADWENAVPVPVGGPVSTIQIDGLDALLFSDQRSGASSIVWRRAGELNFLTGRVDPDVLADVASSVR